MNLFYSKRPFIIVSFKLLPTTPLSELTNNYLNLLRAPPCLVGSSNSSPSSIFAISSPSSSTVGVSGLDAWDCLLGVDEVVLLLLSVFSSRRREEFWNFRRPPEGRSERVSVTSEEATSEEATSEANI